MAGKQLMSQSPPISFNNIILHEQRNTNFGVHNLLKNIENNIKILTVLIYMNNI